jgi:hypothetical protein
MKTLPVLLESFNPWIYIAASVVPQINYNCKPESLSPAGFARGSTTRLKPIEKLDMIWMNIFLSDDE